MQIRKDGAQPIDQFVFEDSDYKLYLIYGGWRHCNIVKLRDDLTGVEPMEDGTLFKEITPQGYVEGPFMFIRNGKYYIVYHRRPLGQKDRNAREVCIDKMEFDENGFIKPVIITKEGVPVKKAR